MLTLTKNESLSLKKADGSNLSKVRVGAAWDPQEGKSVDIDLFVIAPGATTLEQVAFFNNRTGLKGVVLSEDNRTGEGDGDDESVKMDATQTSDGVYTVALNIYDANAKGQSFANIKNAKATVYNDETNEVIATFDVSGSGSNHDSLILGTLTDAGDSYVFTAKGDYVYGNIEDVMKSIAA